VRKRLFTFAAGVSLVLFSAVLLLWGRSYFRSDWIDADTHSRAGWYRWQCRFRSDSGLWLLAINQERMPGPAHVEWLRERPYFIGSWQASAASEWVIRNHQSRSIWNRLGFSCAKWLVWGTGYEVTAPFWVVAATLGALSIPRVVALARSWRRRSRISRGQCALCGYDLRATPDRCPECGGVAPLLPKTREA
jgi:hypothetical protein